ncbi:hypothetical protein [Nocardia tengchongensis]|uniref:hypothetical protein n=1 Tax=Nocardia tengchongensis TaxID=2055889 RepID=UPI00361FF90C
MTSRSRQAVKLAQLLSERTGRTVRHAYDGPGWHLEWVDGPTCDRMRTMAIEYAHKFPDLPLKEFRFYRSQTDAAEVVAWLLWIDADLERAATYAPTFQFRMAYDATDDPDRAPEVWQRRGRALHALISETYNTNRSSSPTGPSGHTIIAETMAARIKTDGWEAVLLWLDEQAEGHRGRHLRIVD